MAVKGLILSATLASYVAINSISPVAAQSKIFPTNQIIIPDQQRLILQSPHSSSILTSVVEQAYITAPIIVGHDMDNPDEYSRFTDSITNAIANGYTPVSIYDLLRPLVSGLPLDVEKPFAVTLDDGYKSQLRLVGFFQQNNIHAHFFVIPTYQDGVHDYMDETDWLFLIDAGQYVGAHTTRHLDLTRMDIDDAVSDVLLSQKLIGKATGITPNVFAYPTGAMNEELISRLSGHFVSAVSTAGGVIRYRANGGKIKFADSHIQHSPANVMGLDRVYAF